MERIRFEHISKSFGEVIANHDISFAIEKGSVVSILGENGSGKTTLLNVLDGIYQADEGSIYLNGEETIIKSPKDAYTHGIGMVHQHFKLVNVFTAIENIVLGLSRRELLAIREQNSSSLDKPKRRLKYFDLKEQAQYVLMMCNKYGFEIDPFKHVYDMSVSEKQTLEIIKALYRGVDVLVLDEPTAVLTPQEIKKLFDVVRNMKKDGKTVIIITHKLNEVMEISDQVVVLRKGEFINQVNTSETTESKLAVMMVGHKIDLDIHRSEIPNTGVRLHVENLNALDKSGLKALTDISFDLYGSEILGIAGVSGSGQKELLDTIAGLNSQTNGDIIFTNPKKNQPVTFFHKDLKQIRELAQEGKLYFKRSGEPCSFENYKDKELMNLVNKGQILFYEDEIMSLKGLKPIEIRNLGIKLSFVPEDRLGMGLVGDMDLVDNMMLRSYRKGKGTKLHREKPEELAKKLVDELEIKTPNIHTPVRKLSGGNIQKILVGREISTRPKILMVAYPVRGLDINSSYQIYKLLDKQKKAGTAIMFVGEDLDVLIGLSDRIMVLNNGHITGIVDPRVTTKEEIGLLMGKTIEVNQNEE